MVVELLQSVKELSDKCVDVQKEVDVYKEIMHNHSQNFTNAIQLINQLEPVKSESREILRISCSRYDSGVIIRTSHS